MVKRARLHPSTDPEIGVKAEWLKAHDVKWVKDYHTAVGPAPIYSYKIPDIIVTFENDEDLNAFIIRFGKIAFDASQEHIPTKLEFNRTLLYKMVVFQ